MAKRPLSGQTVLAVEDSRFACEALRIMCQRSGARLRRADSLEFAARHLRIFRPGIVLIDVGLPDGSTLALIRELSRSEARIGVARAMSGDDTFADVTLAAGADTFIAKPIKSVSAFQATRLAELPKDARPARVRPVSGDAIVPDRITYRDDLSLAADLLASDADVDTLNDVTHFLIGLANRADDPGLADVARDVERACSNARHQPTASKGSEPQSKTASRQSRRSNPAGPIRLVFG